LDRAATTLTTQAKPFGIKQLGQTRFAGVVFHGVDDTLKGRLWRRCSSRVSGDSEDSAEVPHPHSIRVRSGAALRTPAAIVLSKVTVCRLPAARRAPVSRRHLLRLARPNRWLREALSLPAALWLLAALWLRVALWLRCRSLTAVLRRAE
jgi:hypothetical protein